MKKLLCLCILVIVFIFSQISIGYAQTWKEMIDSTIAYQKTKDFSVALKWAYRAEVLAKKEFGELDSNYTNSLLYIYSTFFAMYNVDSAIHYCEISLEINRKIYPKGHTNLLKNNSWLAYLYYASGKMEKAAELYKDGLGIMKQMHEGDDPNLANAMNDLAQIYNQMGKFTEAEPLLIASYEMNRRLHKKDHIDLARSINGLASFYTDRGRFTEAEPLYNEALEMRRRLFQGDHPDIANSLNNLGYFYELRGKYNEAEPIYKESLEMKRRLYKGDHPNVATTLSNLSLYYFERGRYTEAEPFYKEALEMRRRLFKGDNPDLSTSLNNIAAFYNDRGYYSEAEPFYVEALEMNKRIYKNDHPNLAGSYLSMAYFYIGRGRYAEAEPLLINSLEMYRRLYKLDHPNLVAAINNTAMFYNDMGRYDKAEALYKESLEMNRRLYKIDNISLAVAINNMAYFYEGRERYADAEPLFNEALEMRRRLFKGDQPDLATSISNLGGLYEDLQEYEKAEPLYKEGLAMRKRLFNSPHPAIAQSLNILATFYFGQSRYTEAEPLYKEALEMRRKLYNSDHQELSRSIKWTARFYEDLSRYFEAETLFIEGLQVNINMLNNYFPSLSEKEKKQFWNIVSNDFQWFNNFGIHRYSENKKISGHMYDFQLYSKSLLLNSSSRIKNRILNSGDSALVSQYQRWSDIKEYLVKLYKMSNDELKKKNLNLDSIETIANNLEKELSLKSEAFKQSFEKKKVTWKSIQTLLKPDEAAVEVVRFRYKDKKRFTDTIYYAFLIVTDQTEEHPDLVVLENGNELENEFYTEYRNNTKNRLEDKKSFDRYWSKLYEKTKGYKRIFFSADGVYNKLNPSTFKLPDGKFLIDVQDIQQVNTTKDLLTGYYQTKQESNIYNSALLIGNPNFSLSEEQVQQASRKIRGNKEEEKSYESLASTRGINLTKLPGTEKEINDIEKFLKGRNWIVNSYLGDSALKTAVTTANNPRVLHIATHGLFLEDVKRESKGIFGFDEKKMIENPLLRSGLFFTGADNYLKKENPNLNDAEDNGLLTAYEAMNLDLDKTELVVLSACETGLGEIQNGEGVFGLRRAFQQAGAKTIMMSLWKVNDDATQQLMSSFYKNWVTGMTKRDAFSKAQQEVRTKYKDPYYWGAFVMVGE